MIDGKDFTMDLDDFDPEIRQLVSLINNVDGVETIESCFGHHENPCRIWFRIKDIPTANNFIRQFFYFDPLWRIVLTFCECDYTDELVFMLESKYQDYPTVDLSVETLTRRFEDRQGRAYTDDGNLDPLKRAFLTWCDELQAERGDKE